MSDLASTGSTSSSLLERARARDPEAWRRLVDLYGPLVMAWCRRFGLPEAELADVFQETLAAVATHLGGFRRDRSGGSFRGWLWTITRNKVHDSFRRRHVNPLAMGGAAGQDVLDNLVSPVAEPSSESDERELLLRALDLVRGDFEDRTWHAFWQVVVEGQSAGDVAPTLGLTINAVYKARARVLARLREELGDLLD